MSGFVDSDKTQWHYVKMVAGEIPATPTWYRLRGTAEGINRELTKSQSNEITGTKDVSDYTPTAGGIAGDVNFEFHYDFVIDEFLQNVYQGSFDEFGVLKAGTDSFEFALQRTMTDETGTKTYRIYRGLKANSFAVELDPTADQPITVTLNLLGLDMDTSGEIAGSTYVEANTGQPFFMPEQRVLSFTGTHLSGDYCFTNLGFTTNLNAEALQGKCTGVTTFPDLSAVDVVQRTKNTELNLSVYQKDNSFDDWYANNTTASTSYVLSNGVEGYKFTFPRLVSIQDQPPVSGINSSLIDEAVAGATLDPTEGTSVIVEKIPNMETDAGIKLEEVTTPPSPDFRGTFYKDGTLNDAKAVYASVDGVNATWWSTADSAWTVTAYGDIGTFPTVAGWKNANASDPTGAWAIIGTATGDMAGTAYNPLV